MRDAGQATPFDTVRGDDKKIDSKLAVDHSSEAALIKRKVIEAHIKQGIGFQTSRQPQAEGGIKINRWNHPVPPAMSGSGFQNFSTTLNWSDWCTWCGNELKYDNGIDEWTCKDCNSNPGISDGLLTLRTYSALHPSVLSPELLEDGIDCSAEFAKQIIGAIELQSGSTPAKAGSQSITAVETTTYNKPGENVNTPAPLNVSEGSSPMSNAFGQRPDQAIGERKSKKSKRGNVKKTRFAGEGVCGCNDGTCVHGSGT